jgi:hypothetical protein
MRVYFGRRIRGKQALAVWSKSAVAMFSTRKASFRGAFAKPGSAEFRNLGLENCYVVNSSVGSAKHQNVEWGRRPAFLLAAQPRSIAGESIAKSTEEFRALGAVSLRRNGDESAQPAFPATAPLTNTQVPVPRLS